MMRTLLVKKISLGLIGLVFMSCGSENSDGLKPGGEICLSSCCPASRSQIFLDQSLLADKISAKVAGSQVLNECQNGIQLDRIQPIVEFQNEATIDYQAGVEVLIQDCQADTVLFSGIVGFTKNPQETSIEMKENSYDLSCTTCPVADFFTADLRKK